MILKQIRLQGFRGVKQELTIPFGRGFTVISGRNGTGKSTVCDAIEYVLTGQLSRFSSNDVEDGERIADYIWWRGSKNSSDERRVTATFISDQGTEIERSVDPNGKGEFDDTLLYDPYSGPPDAIARLCQTAIIRAESIVKLSTDLKEADRFDFVHKAVGTTTLAGLERRASSLSADIKKSQEAAEEDYRLVRQQVTDLISRLSEIKVDASKGLPERVEETQNRLSRMLGAKPLPLRDFISLLQNTIAETRKRVAAIEKLQLDYSNLAHQQLELEQLDTKIKTLAEEVRAQESIVKDAEEQRVAVAELLKVSQTRSPIQSSLAKLIEHGASLGLQEGQCPLCGSAISEKSYQQHIETIRADIDRQNGELRQLVEKEASQTRKLDEAKLRFEATSLEFRRAVSSSERMKSLIGGLEKDATTLELKLNQTHISEALHASKTTLIDLEAGLNALQASVALEKISEMEQERAILEERVDQIAGLLEKYATASQNAKTIADTIKRVSWEVVDDRLAGLSPLLSELYMRLRPHVDYTEVKYRMRGDVRRFLSLNVGDGINPRFTFSSGQRRTLGLAFLFAVHLSRPWCHLRTLVLDDPIQHIDDYRALNLIEVLSGIRQLGEQVICTVEDPALAELLCRRLRSTDYGDGIHVQLEYESGTGIRLAKAQQVGPLPARVLFSA